MKGKQPGLAAVAGGLFLVFGQPALAADADVSALKAQLQEMTKRVEQL